MSKSSPISPFRNPICLSLDVDTREEALKWAAEIGDQLGAIKIGPRLVTRYGADLIADLKKYAPVFVDCKFFDIPSTMVAAVRAAFDAGASVVTVHALAGHEALTEMAKLESELQKQRPFRIIAVTILTSWDQQSFPENFKKAAVLEHVHQLADLVQKSGLKSIVCSPEEAEELSKKSLFLLTPGIRLPGDDVGDQKRVMTPQEALKKGASVLVIGRSILKSKSPRQLMTTLLGECQ